MSFCLIILAGGNSHRFKSNIAKPYQKIAGKSLVEININKACQFKQIKKIILVYNKKDTKRVKSLGLKNVKLILGGKNRQESTYKALKYLINTTNISKVLIHDAARPCLDVRDLKELFVKGNSSTTGLSLGYPLTNALKKVNSGLQVTDNIKRENLYMSFTPQIFNFSKLFLAYTDIIKKEQSVDDEIEAMTKSGHKVKLMRSSPRNIKLTYQGDLEVIKSLMKKI